MKIIGPIPARTHDDSDDGSVNRRELKRLGLDKQAKRVVFGHKDERDDYPIYLCGSGELCLNFPGQPYIMLDLDETASLYAFFELPRVQELMIGILRASLIKAGHGEAMDALLALPNDHKQAILWAFGRAEKPSFLDADAA